MSSCRLAARGYSLFRQELTLPRTRRSNCNTSEPWLCLNLFPPGQLFGFLMRCSSANRLSLRHSYADRRSWKLRALGYTYSFIDLYESCCEGNAM
eukprot:jgi/Botrbrau1/17825/Bobra.0127s0070.1